MLLSVIFRTRVIGDWLQDLIVFVMIPLMVSAGIGVVMWLVNRGESQVPLTLHFARGDYVGFIGLHPQFLAALPELPPQ